MTDVSRPTALDGRRLLELQLELECIRVVAGDTLVPFPCPNPDPPARFSVVRHDGTWSAFFRHDLPGPTRARLAALPPERGFRDHERIKAILDRDAPCQQIWAGASYVFPDELAAVDSPEAVRLDARHRLLPDRACSGWESASGVAYVIVVAGAIVATCCASRENDVCAEAWVTTAPEYRRRGYARQVTAAWARAVRQRGRLPFYSHAQSNVASRAVARSLGLIRFLEGVGYT